MINRTLQLVTLCVTFFLGGKHDFLFNCYYLDCKHNRITNLHKKVTEKIKEKESEQNNFGKSYILYCSWLCYFVSLISSFRIFCKY